MASNVELVVNEQEQKVNEDAANEGATNSFADGEFPEKLLKGIQEQGLENPTEGQRKLFTAWNIGQNVLFEDPSEKVRQQSLCLTILKKLDTKRYQCQAVIFTSTKDRAVLVKKILDSFGVHMGVKSCFVAGGETIRDDIDRIQAGVHVVLGTPGRILDMIKRKVLNTEHLTSFAVENLNDFFKTKNDEQICSIFGFLSTAYQLVCLSSMMHKTLIKEASKFWRVPPTIIIEGERFANTDHLYVCVPSADEKLSVLLNYLNQLETKKSSHIVVFCGSWHKLDYLSKRMQEKDFCFTQIHSRTKAREQRENLSKFYSGHVRILMATTDLATSIANSNIDIVIHFDAPLVRDDYMQRFAYIRPNTSFSIITQEEEKLLLDAGKEYCLSMHVTSLDF